MKIVITIILIIASFIGGVYFENSRLIDEPDKTIAIMLSKLGASNSKHQIELNNEYLQLIENQEFETLKEKLMFSNEVLNGIKTDTESICNEVKCTPEQLEYLNSSL